MGPLWAWVVLWLLSAYGLVLLLRFVMTRSVQEAVSVLVATPRPVEPELSPAPESSVAAQATEQSEVAPQESPRDPVSPGESPERDAIASPLAIDDFPGGPDAGSPEAEDGEASEPWIKEREAREASEPWIKERDLPEAAERWAGGTAESGWSEPVYDVAEDPDPVVYRAIELESLTLGLQSAEVQGLYGPPGHMSKIGEDGEQWRYPLNATDDRGQGLEGVLVLEFQRGRLVHKALEQAEAESGGA